MAIVVELKDTKDKYILLGTGFGAFKATRPSLIFGNFAPVDENGEMEMVAICNNTGNIGWVQSSEVTVIEVDGKSILDILGSVSL